jgi:hypothetical protein
MQSYEEVSLVSGGESADFQLPPPGTYKIRFAGVIPGTKKEFPRTRKDEETGQKTPIYNEDGSPAMEVSYTFQFVIDDEEDDFDGTEFRDFFPLYISRPSKKYPDGNKSCALWAALKGVTAAELHDEPIPKTTWFEGRRCEATLGHRIAASNGRTYLYIKSATPLKKRRERPAAEPVQELGEPNF